MILIKIPSREREEQCQKVVDQIYATCGVPFQIVVVNDKDCEYSIKGADVLVTERTTKVGAFNAAQEVIDSIYHDWSLCLMAADDLEFICEDWGKIVMEAAAKYPERVLHFPDGFHGENLNTHPFIPKSVYLKNGYLFYPEYRSFFPDPDLMKTDPPIYIDQQIFRHMHPETMNVESDALYQHNSKDWFHDQAIFNRRWNA